MFSSFTSIRNYIIYVHACVQLCIACNFRPPFSRSCVILAVKSAIGNIDRKGSPIKICSTPFDRKKEGMLLCNQDFEAILNCQCL